MILHQLIDYDTLRVIWWLLLGVILIGFAVTDGFDLGVGMLLPFAGRSDVERRVVINTIGPVWEGNQVWLILGGGAIFAAWPPLYAVSFSGFYLAMFGRCCSALILRPVGLQIPQRRAKGRAPGAQAGTGRCSPAASCRHWSFGVAIGNVLQGVPFRLWRRDHAHLL
jgi:cytochrome d ubiquinol oxidase subunit II